MIVNAILLNGNSFIETIKKISTKGVGEDQIVLFLIGFGVVFIALTLIYLLINGLSKIINNDFNKKKKSNNVEDNISKKTETEPTMNNEVNVAIAMALSMYFSVQHDEESLVLTMDIQERMSTQWNNKVQLIS